MADAWRVVRVLVTVLLLNLSLSVALSQAAVSLPSKGAPIMRDHNCLNTSLERRVKAGRRVERARTKPAVLPAAPSASPRLLSFVVPSYASQTYAVSAAPPDHPPA